MSDLPPPPDPTPGWYPNPEGEGRRYWDGIGWSRQVAGDKYQPYGRDAYQAPEPPAGAAVPPSQTWPTGPPLSSMPASSLYPYREAKNTSNLYSIIAFVVSGIALLFCPILLGLGAIALGGVARSRREPLAAAALTVAILCMVVGIVLGIVVYTSLRQ